MRSRNIVKEGPNFRYKLRTENERIVQSLNDFRYLDHAPCNNKMLITPNWKPETKEKWMGPV